MMHRDDATSHHLIHGHHHARDSHSLMIMKADMHITFVVSIALFLSSRIPHNARAEGSLQESTPESCFLDDNTTESDFVSSNLQPNEICPMIPYGTKDPVSKYAFRMGLPKTVVPTLRKFVDDCGITDKFRILMTDGSLTHGQNEHSGEWYIQRPSRKWNSTMHWISPGGEAAHLKYLHALSNSGFDQVLNAIGTTFGFDGLVCYHLTFIGVDYSQDSFLHYDNKNTGGKVFNMIIPLYLADSDQSHELELRSDDTSSIGGYKYRLNEAILVGDGVYHRTANADYRADKEVRIAATIYMADVNSQNVKQIMKDYTQHYPPRDSEMLLSKAASHWNASDVRSRLPRLQECDVEVKAEGDKIL